MKRMLYFTWDNCIIIPVLYEAIISSPIQKLFTVFIIMLAFNASFYSKVKLFSDILFSISFRPLFDTLLYTLHSNRECRVEYLKKEDKKMKYKKDYGNLTEEIIKGEGGWNIINKNRKYFIGEANKALKRTIHRLTEVCRLHEGASLRNNIWPHFIPPKPAFGGLRHTSYVRGNFYLFPYFQKVTPPVLGIV